MKADYEDIVYGCVKCGYAVKSKLSIRKHKKTVHEGSFIIPLSSYSESDQPIRSRSYTVVMWLLTNIWYEDSDTIQPASKVSLPLLNNKEVNLEEVDNLWPGKNGEKN